MYQLITHGHTFICIFSFFSRKGHSVASEGLDLSYVFDEDSIVANFLQWVNINHLLKYSPKAQFVWEFFHVASFDLA